MADGYGQDLATRTMFLREAEQGPTAQELATMTAPFGGSVEQAQGFMQSPEVQQRLHQMGISGFDPSQIRQSPFFPNQFMQGHPLLGGALTRGMANMAATPEAPLVSGAGSGLSRATQGMYGGNDLLRQFQVRQMMAPFQAMGMQLPIMAEQRRQELLKTIEADLNQRRGIEAQTQPQLLDIRRMQAEAAEERARAAQTTADATAQWRQAQASMPKTVPGMGLIYPGGGMQTEHPSGMPAELGGQVSQQGARFQPFDQTTIDQYIKTQQAIHPERKSLADWRKALIDEGLPEAEASYYAQRAIEATAKAHEAEAKAKNVGPAGGAKGGWSQKEASKLEGTKATAQNAILKEYAPTREKYKNDQEWQQKDPNTYNNFMNRMQQLEDQYAERGRQLGGTYPGYTYPGMHSSLPPQNPFNPGATPPPSPEGGAGAPQARW